MYHYLDMTLLTMEYEIFLMPRSPKWLSFLLSRHHFLLLLLEYVECPPYPMSLLPKTITFSDQSEWGTQQRQPGSARTQNPDLLNRSLKNGDTAAQRKVFFPFLEIQDLQLFSLTRSQNPSHSDIHGLCGFWCSGVFPNLNFFFCFITIMFGTDSFFHVLNWERFSGNCVFLAGFNWNGVDKSVSRASGLLVFYS